MIGAAKKMFFLMLDRSKSSGIRLIAKTKTTSQQLNTNNDGVVVTYKTFARLLNFILFLILVSVGMSHATHAASVSGAAEHVVSNTTVELSGIDTNSTKNEISDNQLPPKNNSVDTTGTSVVTTTQLDSTDPKDATSTNETTVQNQTDSHTSLALNTQDNSSTPASNVLASHPDQPVPFVAHHSIVHSVVNQNTTLPTQLNPPVAPQQQPPAAPTNSHDTGILNASITMGSTNVTKSFFDRFVQVGGIMISSIAHKLPISATSLLLVALILSSVMVWMKNGFGQVISPRGQSHYHGNQLLQLTEERYGLSHNALFRAYAQRRVIA